MSLATIFDRTVDLEVTAPDGEDARGNETRESSTIADVPAYRFQVGAEEDTADRDQQARTFVYYLPVRHLGTDVEVNGRDRIVDGDETLEVLGAPIVATKRTRRHHLEVRAYLVDG